MGMTMTMTKLWCRARRAALDLARDRKGLAAIEFAMLVPIMLVMFFGVVELSSGVAVDRKVTLVARTLSDLTSQSSSIDNTDLTSFFNVKNAMLTPYSPTPVQATISELYIDPTTLKARVQWSYGQLSDHGRGQLSLRAHGRLRDVEDGYHPDVHGLHAAAPDQVRHLSDPGRRRSFPTVP
jgi:Flp pilus assembly protein TadG